MLRQFVGVVFLIACCLSSLIHGEVVEVQTVKDIDYDWKSDTWFLVDLDNCLFEAKQAYGHADWFYYLIEERMSKGMTKTEAILDVYPYWIEVQRSCEVQPIELDFVFLIKELQKKGVKVMGLTHRQPSVVDSTIRQVHSLGLDFRITSPNNLTGLSIDIDGPAVFEDGILFVGDYNSKGDVLSAFFNKVGIKPSRVVFIDDKRKNVDVLESLFGELKVDYLGIHYTAINRKPRIYDSRLAEIQGYYFTHILSNDEALQLDGLYRDVDGGAEGF